MIAASVLTLVPSYGQQFAAPDSTGLGLSNTASGAVYPNFVDIDGDGDLDIFSSDLYIQNGIRFLRNLGTAQSPRFAQGTLGSFGLERFNDDGVYTTFSDLDSDGDYDMLLTTLIPNPIEPGSRSTELSYIINTGTSNSPDFSSQKISLNDTLIADAVHLPSVADLDGDGDDDLLLSGYSDGLNFLENISTNDDIKFAALQNRPFGIPNTPLTWSGDLADLDNDGDFDILAIQFTGYAGNPQRRFIYFENTGSSTRPEFGLIEANPFGLNQSNALSIYSKGPILVDIDTDGDIDIFEQPLSFSNYYNQFGLIYFENTQVSSVFDIAQNIIPVYPNPASTYLSISDDKEVISIEVFNMNGAKVYSLLDFNESEIKIEHLANGVYMLQIRYEDGNSSNTLLVKE